MPSDAKSLPGIRAASENDQCKDVEMRELNDTERVTSQLLLAMTARSS